MRKIERSEIVDYETYADHRLETRPLAIEVKRVRRIHAGEHFTFLFENRETVRYQVQEMMRIERIVREPEIQHELDTYNELLHEGGTLGCTLFIEIDDPVERDQKLTAWKGLVAHVFATLPDGTRIRPTYDKRQVGEERLSSVQYLAFELGPKAPIAIGVDLSGAEAEATLTGEQRAALQADLDEP